MSSWVGRLRFLVTGFHKVLLASTAGDDLVRSDRCDYTLYPKWEPAIGFQTRGCFRHCEWCIVPYILKQN